MLSVVEPAIIAKQLDGEFYRLIPSRFPTIDVYERVAPPSRWPALLQIETLTNSRSKERQAMIGTDQVESPPPHLQNWNHAPFVYVDPDGSSILSAAFGVLEVGQDKETAIAMAVARRESFLSATSLDSHPLEMRMLKHSISGRFASLGDLSGLSQSERWALGASLYEHWDGAYFTCPETGRGATVAIFNVECLGRATQAEHYRFMWDGSRIRTVYNFNDLEDGDGKGFDPQFLRAGNMAA
jgi:hypothetical protein